MTLAEKNKLRVKCGYAPLTGLAAFWARFPDWTPFALAGVGMVAVVLLLAQSKGSQEPSLEDWAKQQGITQVQLSTPDTPDNAPFAWHKGAEYTIITGVRNHHVVVIWVEYAYRKFKLLTPDGTYQDIK